MNRYQPETPRFAFALASIALTAATIGLLAIAPAQMDFRSQQVPVVALTDVAPLPVADLAAPDALVDAINVHAVRESRLVTVVESRRVQQDRLRG